MNNEELEIYCNILEESNALLAPKIAFLLKNEIN